MDTRVMKTSTSLYSLVFSFALLLSAFPGTLSAQGKGDGGDGNPRLKERIRIQRAAIYSDVLKLTSEEAQQFWPIYNQFLDDKEAIQKQLHNLKTDGLTDAQAEETIKKHFELQQRDLDIEKEMVQKLRKVISPQKIAKIPDAERVFRRTVVDKLRERQENKGNKRATGKN